MPVDILDAIDETGSIPAAPAVVTRLLELTRSPDYDQNAVIKLIASDPGVTADVLKLANSALFGLSRRVDSLPMAVSLLGLRRIRTLVVGRCLVQAVSGSAMPHVDAGYFWRRSVTTGGLAARFADQLASPLREQALLGGLLSEVGIPVLANCAPERYQPAAVAYGKVTDEEFVDREIDTVGTSHAVVGQRVFDRWGLPESTSLAVRDHHVADSGASTGATVTELAQIVHGASVIAGALCETPISRDVTETCEDVLFLLELNNGVLHRILRELEADLAELASNLNIAPLCRRSLALMTRSLVERLPVTA